MYISIFLPKAPILCNQFLVVLVVYQWLSACVKYMTSVWVVFGKDTHTENKQVKILFQNTFTKVIIYCNFLINIENSAVPNVICLIHVF